MEKWKKYPVLDKGYVCLVDVMGDDAAVVQAARVCFGKGTKSVSDDNKLLRYLMRKKHFSVWEMCEIKLMIKAPIYVFRQFWRHRQSNITEQSGRYSLMDEFQFTKECDWRLQSKDNKMGSKGFYNGLINFSEEESDAISYSINIYNKRIDNGIAREQARKDLPLSTYSKAYWKMDLRNLFNMLLQRMDEHAQLESRQYANTIYSIVKQLFPESCKAFEDYQLNSMTLTALDIKQIKHMLIHLKSGWITEWMNDCRERKEFVEKATELGIMF